MQIIVLTKPKSGVDYHRISLPIRYMGEHMEHGDQIVFFNQGQNPTRGMFAKANIVFFSRECPFNFETILELRDVYGFRMVVDVDDFWYLYPHHYLSNTWLKNKTSSSIIDAMTKADAVITTNERLANRIEPINSNVHVVPNALPFEHEQFNSFTVNRKPGIIYAAGLSHLNDLRTIVPALHMCKSDKALEHTKFIFAGSNGEGEIGRKLKSVASSFGKCEMVAPLPPSIYMDLYNQGTVAIAPLQNNEFNSFKSNLKVLEAGCKKLPIVASAVHPYLELDGVEGVFLCKGVHDWYRTLRMLLLNPHKAEIAGEALHEHVKNKYDLRKLSVLRKIIFKSLIHEPNHC